MEEAPDGKRRATTAPLAKIGTELSRGSRWPVPRAAATKRLRGQAKWRRLLQGFPPTVPLTPRLSGRPETPDWSRGCRLSSRTRGDTTELHGPLQAVVRGTAVTAKRSHPSHLALPHRAHARSSDVERRALTEAAAADATRSAAARHRSALGRLIGTELSVEPDGVSAPRQRRVFGSSEVLSQSSA